MPSTTAKKTDTSKPEPPPAALAQDAHWAATRERLRNRTRPTVKLTICDDVDVKTDLDAARYALRRIKSEAEDRPDDAHVKVAVAAAQADVDQAQAAYDEAAIVLRFQALPRPEFEALKKAHPPTEEQAEDDIEVDVEALGPALIAASSLDGITVDEAREYLDTWAEGEAAALFSTAWKVQGQARMDLGKG